MILPFSQHLNEKPTYFVEKITRAYLNSTKSDFLLNEPIIESIYHINQEILKNCKPKLHTIRPDVKNRWKAGNKIHAVINNRSKNMLQFVPVMECKSVQLINIRWFNDFCSEVEIDGVILDTSKVETLAVNDGFDRSVDFFKYFNTNFAGKLIHWTDLKY